MSGAQRDVLHRFALILSGLLALLAAPVAAQDFPARPAGPVYDGANLLADAEEAALDQKLRAYNQQTGRAIIVATVPSLDGQPADMYAQQLAETWDVSGAESEEGVLMLVAPAEREAWITTARGVQTTLTDAMAGRIFRDIMVPRFKAGDYPGGIAAGVDGVIETLDMDPATAKAIEEAEAAAARDGGGEASFGGVFFWIVLIVFFMLIFGRGRGGRRRRYGAAGVVGDIILWNAIGHAIGGSGRSGGWGGGGGGGSFGGFGGGGGGFNGGGAGGSW